VPLVVKACSGGGHGGLQRASVGDQGVVQVAGEGHHGLRRQGHPWSHHRGDARAVEGPGELDRVDIGRAGEGEHDRAEAVGVAADHLGEGAHRDPVCQLVAPTEAGHETFAALLDVGDEVQHGDRPLAAGSLRERLCEVGKLRIFEQLPRRAGGGRADDGPQSGRAGAVVAAAHQQEPATIGVVDLPRWPHPGTRQGIGDGLGEDLGEGCAPISYGQGFPRKLEHRRRVDHHRQPNGVTPLTGFPNPGRFPGPTGGGEQPHQAHAQSGQEIG
jgi:hypothetical protein